MCKCIGKCSCRQSLFSNQYRVLLCGMGKVMPIKNKEMLESVYNNILTLDWNVYKPTPMFIFPPRGVKS